MMKSNPPINQSIHDCNQYFGFTTGLMVVTNISISKVENNVEYFKITEVIESIVYTCQFSNCNDNKTSDLIKKSSKRSLQFICNA